MFSLRLLEESDWLFAGQSLEGGSKNLDGLWCPQAADSSKEAFLWLPPPALGNIAIEQLSFLWHK
jgi:hypothetical protein